MGELHQDGDSNVVCGHGLGLGAVVFQVNHGLRFDGRCATGRSLASHRQLLRAVNEPHERQDTVPPLR